MAERQQQFQTTPFSSGINVSVLENDNPGANRMTFDARSNEESRRNFSLVLPPENPIILDPVHAMNYMSLGSNPAAGIIDNPSLCNTLLVSDDNTLYEHFFASNSDGPKYSEMHHIYTYNPLTPFYGQRDLPPNERYNGFEVGKYPFVKNFHADYIPQLPESLRTLIFKKLDAQSIFVCCQISSTWKDIILSDYECRSKLLRFQSGTRFYKMVEATNSGEIKVSDRSVAYYNRFRFSKANDVRKAQKTTQIRRFFNYRQCQVSEFRH